MTRHDTFSPLKQGGNRWLAERKNFSLLPTTDVAHENRPEAEIDLRASTIAKKEALSNDRNTFTQKVILDPTKTAISARSDIKMKLPRS